MTKSTNSKIGLIYQPCGLGDILFLQKLAHHIKHLGYEVYWPVVSEFEWLNEYIPDFNFVSWDDKEHKLTGPPLPNHVNFPCKEHYLSEKQTEITDELFYFQGFIPISPVMAGKYDSIGLDWNNWRDYIKWNRNIEKENKLFYEVLGLQDGEEYVFVNRTFATRPYLHFFETIPNTPEYYGCKVIELSIIEGYSMFDWFKVFYYAKEIHMIETSLNYFLETPELYDIISKKKLSLYHRPWVSWSEVDYLFNLPWKYN
jgi:hypothetical protein